METKKGQSLRHFQSTLIFREGKKHRQPATNSRIRVPFGRLPLRPRIRLHGSGSIRSWSSTRWRPHSAKDSLNELATAIPNPQPCRESKGLQGYTVRFCVQIKWGVTSKNTAIRKECLVDATTMKYHQAGNLVNMSDHSCIVHLADESFLFCFVMQKQN